MQAELVDPQHVLVVHAGEGTELAPEAGARIGGVERVEQLEGIALVVTGIGDGQHRGHATPRDEVVHAIWTDRRTWGGVGVGGRLARVRGLLRGTPARGVVATSQVGALRVLALTHPLYSRNRFGRTLCSRGAHMETEAYARTDPGPVREHNEDALLVEPRYARGVTRELLRLLGYRRWRRVGNDVEFSRRRQIV